jgi:RHS repeat-associated protein
MPKRNTVLLPKIQRLIATLGGNIMSTYVNKNAEFTWKSSSIYGSSQVAVVETNMLLVDNSGTPVSSTLTTDKVVFYRGKKRYELSNHLGNVLAVITDRRIQSCAGSDSLSASGWIMYYNAQVVSVSDYYPGGSLMTERSWSATEYKFGFNGKESDNEISGNGAVYDYGFRIYDSRLVRFMSVDPLAKSYPWYTPYQFAGNKPIWAVDLDGLEEYFTSDGKLIGKYGESTEIRLVYDDFVEDSRKLLSTESISKADVERINKASAPGLDSKDALALQWGEQFNQQSIDDNKEYSSIIFSTRLPGSSKVTFSYTRPSGGDEASASASFTPKANSSLSAAIHSHGAYSPKYRSNEFSVAQIKDGIYEPGDVAEYVRNEIDGYVSTPNGSLLKYDFWGGGKVIDLGATTVPYDPKDPTSPKPTTPTPATPTDSTTTDETTR